MRYAFFYIILVLPLPNALVANSGGYWQQHVKYNMHVYLDPHLKIVNGYASIEYSNNSPDTLRQIYFHLYPNAYNDSSVMARELRNIGDKLIQDESERGSISIENLVLTFAGQSPYRNLSIGFGEDKTIGKVELPKPLLPQQQLKISLDFSTSVWQHNGKAGRGGYLKNQFVMSQWYPKLCVYDENGWDQTPYHSLGEFYGEFGDFEVTITTPAEYIVGATGTVVAGDPGWDAVYIDSSLTNDEIKKLVQQRRSDLQNFQPKNKTRTVTFYAENVHDFFWIASPDFMYQQRMSNSIPIHFLTLYSSLDSAERYGWIRQSVHTIAWLEKKVGSFPYPSLLVVQGIASENMEYPMVALLGTFRDVTVSHEIIHSYFYGALANNEYRDAWLDEGLVTFLADEISDNLSRQVPLRGDLIGQLTPITNKDIQLNYLYYYLHSSFDLPLGLESKSYTYVTGYNVNFYVKGSMFFRAIAAAAGDSLFYDILRQYYQQWQFKHVDKSRFVTVCNQVTGDDWNPFFEQWLTRTPKSDYAVTNFTTQKLDDGSWKSVMSLSQHGDVMASVVVRLETSTDEKYEQQWRDSSKTGTVTFYSLAKPVRAIVDPDERLMDEYYLNNFSDGWAFKWALFPEYPNYYYLPRDRYLINWWPRLWYNEIDGGKVGVHWNGGYLNRFHLVRGQLWLNSRSRLPDASISLTESCDNIFPDAWLNMHIAQMGGRRQADINLYREKKYQLFRPPIRQWRVGITAYSLFDDRYVISSVGTRFWDAGTVVKCYVNYDADFNVSNHKLQIASQFDWADKSIIGTSSFAKLSLESKLAVRLIKNKSYLNVRLFAGDNLMNEAMPVQEKFGVAGANGVTRWNHEPLRSVYGVLPKLGYYLPGEGNLRGYSATDQTLFPVADRILAVGSEFLWHNFGIGFIKKNRFISKLRLDLDVLLFGEGAWIPDNTDNTKFLSDAGISLAFSRRMFGKERKITIHFPLWINNPRYLKPNASAARFGYRWLLQLNEIL
ncbi:M1 family metallopeptidase [candidate division KSB1 bacterium]|nr:M1 family metallopeptidase [candidate division KSB1 bacterium]